MKNYPKKLIRLIIVSGLMLGNFNFAAGETLNLNQQPDLNLNPLDAFKLNFPFNLNNINIDTNIPISPKVNTSQDKLPDIDLRQFLTPKDVSSDDLGGAIKAVVTLVIQIFLVVISVVSQILKLILELLR